MRLNLDCLRDILLCIEEVAGMQFFVRDLTPAGHELLNDIRSKTVFEKTKAIATELQAQSIPSFQKIASSVISAIVQSHLKC